MSALKRGIFDVERVLARFSRLQQAVPSRQGATTTTTTAGVDMPQVESTFNESDGPTNEPLMSGRTVGDRSFRPIRRFSLVPSGIRRVATATLVPQAEYFAHKMAAILFGCQRPTPFFLRIAVVSDGIFRNDDGNPTPQHLEVFRRISWRPA